MIKNLIVLSLILLFSSIQITADDLSDEEIFNKFISYIEDVYLTNAHQSVNFIDYQFLFGENTISARLLGYSLGNLAKYSRRGSENHKISLMLEKKIKEMILSKTDYEGQMRGWAREFTEDRKQKAMREFQSAQQGWYDDDLARKTNVQPRNAPNFFVTLRAGNTELDTGNEEDTEVENPIVVSDEILGTWTWTHEYTIPHTDRIVRQKLTVDVRRAGTEETSTAYGPRPVYLYKGYIVEIENVTDEWSRPLAAPGDLCWEIRYKTSYQTPSPDYLGYTFNSVLDRMGSFGIRLQRNQGILEIGNAKYYR